MAKTPQPAAPSAADAKSVPPERRAATKFTCLAPTASAVFLAGTFNGWDPKATPMTKDAKGNWNVAVPLPPGRYEFKYVVDGQWCCEPGCEHDYQGCPKCCANEFGTMNRVLEVS